MNGCATPCEGWGGANSLSMAALADLVRRHFPVGIVPQTGENIWITAYAICRAESGGNPLACGDICESIGLWQINIPAHTQYLREWLFDAENNAEAARVISQNGLNWNAWCTWEETACNGAGTGSYRSRLDEARQAFIIYPPPPPPPVVVGGSQAAILLLGGVMIYASLATIARLNKAGG